MKNVLLAVSWFIAGVCMTVACGSTSTGLAEIIAKATDVSYDNSVTKLNATTMQEAIDLIITALREHGVTLPEVETEDQPEDPNVPCFADQIFEVNGVQGVYMCPCGATEVTDECTYSGPVDGAGAA